MRKADVIRYVLEQCGLEPDDETIGRCVMVGDREHDVLGARECGMECVACSTDMATARRWMGVDLPGLRGR